MFNIKLNITFKRMRLPIFRLQDPLKPEEINKMFHKGYFLWIGAIFTLNHFSLT